MADRGRLRPPRLEVVRHLAEHELHEGERHCGIDRAHGAGAPQTVLAVLEPARGARR